MIRLGECVYCHRQDVPLTRDHVVPLSRGGTDRKGNVVWACDPCNNYKGNRLLSELPKDWPQLVLAQLDSRQLPAISYAEDWSGYNAIAAYGRPFGPEPPVEPGVN